MERFPDTTGSEVGASGGAQSDSWQILIVDDDSDVFEATAYALQDVQIFGRPLQLRHARSASEALQLLAQPPEPAVILLDVVMETEQAGLHLVVRIRKELKLLRPRIILRTGQPGRAPELETVTSYDIVDYKTKDELTRQKLRAALTAALRSYDQLRRIDASHQALERMVAASQWFLGDDLRDSFADGVLTQIASFIGVEPEGLVCARPEQPGQGRPVDYRVVAAAGRYRGFVSHPLDDLPDPSIVGSLTQCLQQRRTFVGERSLTLHFAGQSPDDDFAAYIAASQPLRDVDEHLIEVFRGSIAVCGRNVELMAKLRNFAYRDQQVDLPNRRAFVDAVDRARQRGGVPHVIALIDVDDFSNTDELLGQHFGDALLEGMAGRLREGLPEGCFLARVADDKFAVLGASALLQPKQLRDLLAEPFRINDLLYPVSVCIGLAQLDADRRSSADHLKDAQIALKRAKSIGQGQDMSYSLAIGMEMRERSRLVQEIRKAFDNRRLSTVYQPLIDLKTRRVVGVESLMRWWIDEQTMVPPDRFIQVAEQSGMMITLGTWSLRTSLATLKQLDLAGQGGLRMSVNVSAVQFRQPDFVQVVSQALAEYQVQPSRLELEITESAALVGLDQVRTVLEQLRATGISVAVDDFGTGFSSLSYLHRLPIDRLKIDRSFVQALATNEPGAGIAQTVLNLGRQLGVPVLAEGVEDEAQERLLIELGCNEAQGYLFGRPMPSQDLLAWLETHAAAPGPSTPAGDRP